MKLIHYTDYEAIQSIRKEGFKKDVKGERTAKINICLESMKPKNLPDFLTLDTSIQLLPYDSQHAPFGVAGNVNMIGCLQVQAKDLDTDRLYVVNGMYAGRVSYMLDKAYKSEDVEEALTQTIRSQHYKDTISKYWKSLRRYNIYRAMKKNNRLNEDDEITTFLYFDDVEPDYIKEIEFDKRLFLKR